MCNPRRVQVTATRQLSEAWQQEVRRSVELSQWVTGEARVRQSLDASLGTPALRALETALVTGQPGWGEIEDGYRFDVEGGYVIYHLSDQTLEIVASCSDSIQAVGEATATLTGRLEQQIETQAEGHYYDDNWGGRGEEQARQEAEKAAEAKLNESQRLTIEQTRRDAEAAEAETVAARARENAQIQIANSAPHVQQRLEERSRTQLAEVGTRCRQAFHRLLATAYRDAIMAYARQNGAEDIQISENGNVVDIEFMVRRS